MSKVSYLVLPQSLVVTFNGKPHTVSKSDARYEPILNAIKTDKLDTIPSLLDVAKVYAVQGLQLKNGSLYLDGQAIEGVLCDRVIQFQKENIPFEHLIKFARKLRTNPSFNSREQLYKFLEHNGHPITTEGNFIAYRGVTEDFKDVHTKQFDNSVGSICEMDRNKVDDNPNNTCSSGLHVACYNYAKSFGPRLVEVEVDPRDVVCVPTDYNGTKMRTCKFKVVQLCEQLNQSTIVNSSYDSSDEFSKHCDEPMECDGDCYDQCDEHSAEENPSKGDWEQVQLKYSTAVDEAIWNPSTQILQVTLCNGDVYEYYGVTETLIDEWENTFSVGGYYVNHIAHSFKYSKLG